MTFMKSGNTDVDMQPSRRHATAMFQRVLDLAALVRRKSALLIGPRMTGKSTLLRAIFPDAIYLDLLHSGTLRLLAARPERLEDMVRAAPAGRDATEPRVVVIDEVQRVPALLDEAHRLIEANAHLRFVLTGSSARKLRRAGTNLLAGRATRVALHPLVSPERHSDPDVPIPSHRALQWGGLPSVLRSTDPKADLIDYVGLYLQEEVRAEGLTRSFDAFSRFLEVAAATHGEQVRFSAVASDAEVPARTVREYYGVLEDTLVGHLLPPFRATATRKAMATARFYFFDPGVAHALLGRFDLREGTSEYGRAFEHRVFCELRAAIDYRRADARLAWWRSLSQMEVDFVVERRGQALLAIEVKASTSPSARDFRGLRAFAEDCPEARRIVVCRQPFPSRTDDAIDVWPLEHFERELWSGRLDGAIGA